MDYSEKAMKYFEEGYNCSQAVLLAFAERLGLDKETAIKISSGFGGGMGRMHEVCGAVSGMFMVAGLLYGDGAPGDSSAKALLYAKIQELAARFTEDNPSIVCRELLGISQTVKEGPVPDERTKQYYKKRPCRELVGQAAGIVAQYLDDVV